MSEVKQVKVPDIGDFDGVPVIEVLIKVGDTVAKDDGLVTLESDKATMEVPAPFAGTVREVKVSEGDEVAEGDLLALIEPEDGDDGAESTSSGQDAEKDEKQAKGPDADKDAMQGEESAREDAGKKAQSSGKKDADQETSQDRAQDQESSAARDQETDAGRPSTPPVPFDASVIMPDKTPHASPAVRAFARELGVDIGQVEGSGRKGRIQKEDVQAYVKKALARGAKSISGEGAEPGSVALAKGRLQQVRRGRGAEAVAHPEDRRPQSVAQLDDDPARHPARSG